MIDCWKAKTAALNYNLIQLIVQISLSTFTLTHPKMFLMQIIRLRFEFIEFVYMLKSIQFIEIQL